MQIKDKIKLEDKERSLKILDQLFENYEAKTLIDAMKANDSLTQLEFITPLIKEFSNIDVESINNKVQIESYVYTLLNKLADTIGKIPENIQKKIDKCQIYLDRAKHSKISEEEFKEVCDILASIAEDLMKTNPDLQLFPEEIMKTFFGITNQQITPSLQKQKSRSPEEALEKLYKLLEDAGQNEDLKNLKEIIEHGSLEEQDEHIKFLMSKYRPADDAVATNIELTARSERFQSLTKEQEHKRAQTKAKIERVADILEVEIPKELMEKLIMIMTEAEDETVSSIILVFAMESLQRAKLKKQNIESEYTSSSIRKDQNPDISSINYELQNKCDVYAELNSWLRSNGGKMANKFMGAIKEVKEIAERNKVPFVQLFIYVLDEIMQKEEGQDQINKYTDNERQFLKQLKEKLHGLS